MIPYFCTVLLVTSSLSPSTFVLSVTTWQAVDLIHPSHHVFGRIRDEVAFIALTLYVVSRIRSAVCLKHVKPTADWNALASDVCSKRRFSDSLRRNPTDPDLTLTITPATCQEADQIRYILWNPRSPQWGEVHRVTDGSGSSTVVFAQSSCQRSMNWRHMVR